MLDILDVWILLVISLSVLFDIMVRKIPNWLVLFGLAGGLVLNALHGLSQLYGSVLGFLLGVTILFIPFAMGWVGAGDVKCLGVVGSLLGFQWLPRVLFYSVLAAGILAIGFVIRNRANLSILNPFIDAWNDCKLAVLSLGRMLPQDIQARTSTGSHGVPWGVAIGAGTVLAYYIDPHGAWAGF